MKKTLMALGLAFCATIAFAQMPAKKVSRATLGSNAVEKVAQADDRNVEASTFKGSVFSKGDVFKTIDFSNTTDYRTGTITAADGYSVPHTQTKGYAEWFRVADTTAPSCAAAATNREAVVLFSQNWYRNLEDFTSATPMNGLMAMSMIDYINGYSTGTFNSYIEFETSTLVPGDSETDKSMDIKFYQLYRKFNADRCVIDYSTNNGASWDTLEFNVRNVEVATNAYSYGWKAVALPTHLYNESNVKFRIRWFSNSSAGGTYGYYWFIDDVTVESAAANRLQVRQVEYYNGAYHMVPEGMQLNNLVWYANYLNTGRDVQNNVQGYVNYTDGTAHATSVAESGIEPDVVTSHYAYIDQYNNVNNTSSDPSCLGFGNGGTVASFRNTVGTHDIYSGLRTDSVNNIFDTVRYTVLPADATGTRVWGRDNGILSQYSSWTHGLTSDGYLTSDATYSDAGYSVNIVYNTGSEIPEGWVIRGVEYVGSTNPNLVSAADIASGYVSISPTLNYDSVDDQYIYFRAINTGAGSHVVTSAEMNFDDTITNKMMPGTYNTIRIMFPEQPELKANTAYRVGYELDEQGYFCLATQRNFYYDRESGADTGVYYYEDEELAAYNTLFPCGYGLNVRVNTPEAGKATWLATSAGTEIPMIRLLVGPKQDIAKHAITLSCNDTAMGYLYDGATQMGIYGVDSVAEGSSRSYIVYPFSEEEIGTYSEVKSILVDGVEVIGNDECVYEAMGGYYTYTFNNVRAAHTLYAVFGGVGINAINDNVKVSLQPNPATAQSQLVIEGVDGQVNFSLIDMSGRVLSNEVINASEVKTINVSGLAKGTYFVRLTNNNFSKVEKLIVR